MDFHRFAYRTRGHLAILGSARGPASTRSYLCIPSATTIFTHTRERERQLMIEELRRRNFAENTTPRCVKGVEDLSLYFHSRADQPRQSGRRDAFPSRVLRSHFASCLPSASVLSTSTQPLLGFCWFQ